MPNRLYLLVHDDGPQEYTALVSVPFGRNPRREAPAELRPKLMANIMNITEEPTGIVTEGQDAVEAYTTKMAKGA